MGHLVRPLVEIWGSEALIGKSDRLLLLFPVARWCWFCSEETTLIMWIGKIPSCTSLPHFGLSELAIESLWLELQLSSPWCSLCRCCSHGLKSTQGCGLLEEIKVVTLDVDKELRIWNYELARIRSVYDLFG